MKAKLKAEYLAAKKDIDSAIKKHGFAAVKWVINRRIESERLKRELDSEKKRLTKRIQEIEAKLQDR